MNEKVAVYDTKMTKTINNLDSELATIRAGRANPHVLDKLAVDYYGAPTPIQQVANVSVPEARMIQIQPWEKSMLKAIEKAILTSDIGINPTNDGASIRLVFRNLQRSGEKELAKDVKKKRRGGKSRCPQYPPGRQCGLLRSSKEQRSPRTGSRILRMNFRRSQTNTSQRSIRWSMQNQKNHDSIGMLRRGL